MSPRSTKRILTSLAVAAGLTALMGCQQLLNDLGGGGSTGSDAGTSGSVCINGGSGADGLECCQDEGGSCGGDYDCCGGECSGGTCVASSATGCTAALGSRCKTAATCGCSTDADCCQQPTGAVCDASSVTTAGKRCCLTTGIPCGGDGDCCSGSCDATASTCD